MGKKRSRPEDDAQQMVLDGVSSKAASSDQETLEHQGRQRRKSCDVTGKISLESEFHDQTQKVETFAPGIHKK